MPQKPQTATDGISPNPEHAITAIVPYTDWEALRRAFIMNTTHTAVGTWLQQVVGFSAARVRSGHTLQKVSGWGKQRAKIQQQITQAAIEEALEMERRNVPTLRRAKAELIAGILKDVKRWDRLNVMDKKLCYEILKVELREPTNVKDMPPPDARDPVEVLLEEYGLMKDGEIIDDDPSEDSRLISRADSTEAATADSGSPAQIPQA